MIAFTRGRTVRVLTFDLDIESEARCSHKRAKYQGWRFGVVVSVVGRINEVNQHRARLVPWWVTVMRGLPTT